MKFGDTSNGGMQSIVFGVLIEGQEKLLGFLLHHLAEAGSFWIGAVNAAISIFILHENSASCIKKSNHENFAFS